MSKYKNMQEQFKKINAREKQILKDVTLTKNKIKIIKHDVK